MVRPKASASKKPKRAGGVDFKKIRHKIGRKLPPPKNATNTQVKSKAIVLPEQSVASERTGLAVSSRGLTLKELLQQTSHHSPKTRKIALTGIRDLLLKHPSELKLHKLLIIEKLRERICDNDKAVRATLYHILKAVIFPGIKEEITGPVISSMMAYVFNAMTHLALDIRLMAFKFFHLIVVNHPSSILLYAEKVLDCYGDIMRNMQLYLEDKSKVKDVFSGLLHCLSSFDINEEKVELQYGDVQNNVKTICGVTKKLQASNRLIANSIIFGDSVKRGLEVKLDVWKNEAEGKGLKGNAIRRPLHAFVTEEPKDHTGLSSIMKKLEELLPFLINCFKEFVAVVDAMPTIDTLSFNCMLCVLQIINLAVGFSVAEKVQMRSRVSVPSLFKRHDMGNTSVCACLKKLWEKFPAGLVHQSMAKEHNKYFILNIRIAEIFFRLPELMDDTEVLREKFLEFIESALCGQICRNTQSSMVTQEKYLMSVIQLIPRLVSQMSGYWKVRLLKAFTGTFQSCRVDSKLMMTCLCALVEMLLPRERQNSLLLDFSSEELLCYQVAWLCKLPELLLRLGDKHPSISKVILELQLRIGQCSVRQSPLAVEYDNLQLTLRAFYSTYDDLGVRHYGPFVRLPRDCQEIAICGLYYFSSLNSPLLEALAFCCLCDDLELIILLRILEVLHSMCKSGRVKLADHIGFLVTIVARFKVFPEKFFTGNESIGKVSNRGTFKAVTEAVFSCLSEIGDHSLVLRLLQKTMLEEMSLKPHLDNMRAMLSMIVLLDSRPLMFLEGSTLGQNLSAYLIDASYYMPENIYATVLNEEMRIYQFYIRPCVNLFLRSGKLLYEVLKSFSSHCRAKNDFEPSEVHAVASTVIFMLKDAKLHHNLSSSKEAIKNILQNIYILLSESRSNMALEKRHKMQSVFDQLKTEACKLQGFTNVGLTGFGVS